jgi:hypothetical protein
MECTSDLLYTLGLLPFGLTLTRFSYVLNVIREPLFPCWELHTVILCIIHPPTGLMLHWLIYSQISAVDDK